MTMMTATTNCNVLYSVRILWFAITEPIERELRIEKFVTLSKRKLVREARGYNNRNETLSSKQLILFHFFFFFGCCCCCCCSEISLSHYSIVRTQFLTLDIANISRCRAVCIVCRTPMINKLKWHLIRISQAPLSQLPHCQYYIIFIIKKKSEEKTRAFGSLAATCHDGISLCCQRT